MAWIKEITKEESQLLKEIYENAEKRTKEKTANVLRVHSLKPDTLAAHMRLYETIMFGESELSRTQREMIGVVVSSTNKCPYCTSHHSMAMFHASKDQELFEQVALDYNKANLNVLDLEICRYTEKLTKTSYKMHEGDIIKLRELGLSDQAIFDVNQIAAYFNYVNRIVDGLGVELE